MSTLVFECRPYLTAIIWYYRWQWLNPAGTRQVSTSFSSYNGSEDRLCWKCLTLNLNTRANFYSRFWCSLDFTIFRWYLSQFWWYYSWNINFRGEYFHDISNYVLYRCFKELIYDIATFSLKMISSVCRSYFIFGVVSYKTCIAVNCVVPLNSCCYDWQTIHDSSI